jgi:hypothetical protein
MPQERSLKDQRNSQQDNSPSKQLMRNMSSIITFELINDKTSLIDAFGVGEEITVSFNLKGREWKEKFFNTLEAWKVEGIF